MAVKFLKIDILKCKKYLFILALPLFTLIFLGGANSTTPAIFGVGYCLFIGLILSNIPANSEAKGERGFIQMLPAKPGSDVLGHFLFAAVCIVLFAVLSIVVIAIAKLTNPNLSIFEVGGVDVKGLYPVMIGLALVFSGFEVMLLVIFRYKSLMVQQLFRLVPAFIFFFGMMQVSNQAETLSLPEMSYGLGTGSALIFLICVVCFAVFALISARVAAGRE